MNNDNLITIVSIDFCKDYSQVAYMRNNMSEPESLSTVVGEQRYLIPTLVGWIENQERFVVGDEALNMSDRGQIEVADNIIEAILNEEGVFIGSKKYTGFEMVLEYFKGLFELLARNAGINKIDKVIVTVEYPDRVLVNLVRSVVRELGYKDENIKIIGHSESLIYYTIFQKKEIWVNDILVFDFSKFHFLVKRLTSVRARTPQPVIVEEQDLSDEFNMLSINDPADREDLDRRFLQLARKLCESHVVSTVFLVGVGFYEKWMSDSISYLCTRRRVFQGHNLFVKGAGYAGFAEMGYGNVGSYQFVCSGRTVIDIDLETVKDGRANKVTLSKAGTNWYEAGARAEGILDDCNYITLRLFSSLSRTDKRINIDLSNFPDRPNKTTRVEIILAYRNDSQCVVVVKDLGFGEFFKGSDMSVKTTLNIEEYL